MIPAEARGAWREVEARLRPFVARRVAPSDVDDVVQETFVRVYRGLATLEDGERFGAWVYRIAGNAIADHERQRARHAPAPTGEEPAEARDAAPDDNLEAELAECIALFVARLPSPYREAVTLTELEGLTQKDAAAMLGVSLPAIKSQILRGRERIRRMFEDCCEISVDCRGHVMACAARSLDVVPEDCRDAAESWAARHPRQG